MNWLGDFTPGKSIRFRFNTHKADGTPITLAGTPALSVYKGSTTESTAGVTLTVDYDARTGLHDVVIDTSADGAFYAAGSDFDVVITTGTVDSISVVGTRVGTFSLSNRSALRPTTADRTLDVAATGEAGLDFDNVKQATAPTTLTNITIPTVTTLTNAPGDSSGTTTLLSRLTSTRAGLLDNLTNLDASITSLNNLSALANLYGSPLLEIPDSGTTQFAFTLVVRDNEGKLKDLDASPTLTAANAAGTDRSANLSVVSHPSTGRYTFTYGVTSAAAEESLRITVSGAISAEARYVEWVGAVVNYDTLTTLNAIKAKTDNLPADPASAATIASSFATVNATLATISGYIDTEVGAIKVVTDQLGTALVQDGGVYQFTANALELAPTGGGGSAPTTAEIADKILGRNLAGGADGGRTVRDALRPARNKVAFDVPSVGQFTVYAEDDTTPAWTGSYNRTTGAGALTAVDPA